MNFGRAEDLSRVDFSMPPDHPSTALTLKSGQVGTKLFLGATGWSNPEWKGTWYPKAVRPADYLEAYSSLFPTIEFNTTHYRIPDQGLVERWHELSSDDFRFCPKVPQVISHRSQLQYDALADSFCEALSGLREKLGPCFIQLPERLGPEQSNRIVSFMEDWPKSIPLHWEFRHPAWFMGGEEAEFVWDKLLQHGHGSVITDVAGRRDVLHMRLTNPVAVVRFVGNDLHPSDYQRALDWIDRLKSWSQSGLQACYFFVHQPEMGVVPEFSAWIAEKLELATGVEVRHPHPVNLPPKAPTLFDFT